MQEGGTVVKEGYLWKEGGNWKTWKKRWFALRVPFLLYFDSETKASLKGVIHLGSDTEVALTQRGDRQGCFLITHPNEARVFIIQAETTRQCDLWMQAIRDAAKWTESLPSFANSVGQLRVQAAELETVVHGMQAEFESLEAEVTASTEQHKVDKEALALFETYLTKANVAVEEKKRLINDQITKNSDLMQQESPAHVKHIIQLENECQKLLHWEQESAATLERVRKEKEVLRRHLGKLDAH